MNKDIAERQRKTSAGLRRFMKKIHDAEEAGAVTIGWERGVYPVEETARAALKKKRTVCI